MVSCGQKVLALMEVKRRMMSDALGENHRFSFYLLCGFWQVTSTLHAFLFRKTRIMKIPPYKSIKKIRRYLHKTFSIVVGPFTEDLNIST